MSTTTEITQFVCTIPRTNIPRTTVKWGTLPTDYWKPASYLLTALFLLGLSALEFVMKAGGYSPKLVNEPGN